jgi:hypothetical protein
MADGCIHVERDGEHGDLRLALPECKWQVAGVQRPSAVRVNAETVYSGRREADVVMTAGSTGRCNTIQRVDSTMLSQEKPIC